MTKNRCFLLILPLLLCFCSTRHNLVEKKINTVAEYYIKLVLEIGLYDPEYVDAYYGPDDLKPEEISEEDKKNFPYEKLMHEAIRLLGQMKSIDIGSLDKLWKLRYEFLKQALISVLGRIEIVSGEKMTFDEESQALYDIVVPGIDLNLFKEKLIELDQILPGEGSFNERYHQFRNKFIVPEDKIDAVFQTAIAECRKRTKAHIHLPEGEKFIAEYVKDVPWGAYNWYKGNFTSVIQINTDSPFYLYEAVDYASHEGYPGHHVHLSMLESNLLRKRYWIEYSIVPLYSPFTLITEGIAVYGYNMIFPNHEKIEFEKDILAPLAGLDASEIERYYQIREIRNQLAYARVEIAREYLDGQIDRTEAIHMIQKFMLSTQKEAEQSLKFIDHYRSYLINYAYGEELIKHYLDSHADATDSLEKRWAWFEKILSTPRTPSNLQ